MKLKGKAKNTRLLVVSRTLMAAAVVAAIVGASVIWSQYQHNKETDEAIAIRTEQANNGQATGDNPSTIKPGDDAFTQHRVAPDEPRYIFIPKMGVRAMVKQVGLTRDGAIDAPSNAYDTAWYTGSAKPGQPGATLIDGHGSSYPVPHIFYNLHKLQIGDDITIELGSGKIITYKVVASQAYPADRVDMAKVLSPINPNKSGLNLITCSGDIIKGTNNFDHRTVVFAEQQ